ncbi:MAG: winged helix-turn-helix transcriptional regulator [Pelagibacterales bacterium]|jgi:DNA-binding MarR family transcriptional regulator|nr:winged helix-turn-helix transcriptional regulator [Pelagibacterales bacterium]MDG2267784.1 MarR family winged helix-turn-helix transcriptional regulator [Alphaproteobacteria bacterium]|tara:strand:- start:3045 stop:3512 length:468 start_codon:yes stop_codon:yes gene_type:complete
MTQINSKTNLKVSKTKLRSWLKILKTSNFIEKQIREKLREDHNTTLPRFDVMSALYRSKKGLKMTEISGALKVSNGNITGIIDRLVQDGHVLRVAVEGDRRTNLVSLTNKGKNQFEEYANAHESWINIILEKLSEQEAQDLINLLDIISYNRSRS